MDNNQQFQILHTKLFINNEFVDSVDGNKIKVINPATEQEICQVSRAGEADAEKAVKAARECFDDPKSVWRQMSAYSRGMLIYKLADLMESNINELAFLESLNNGKPFIIARDVDLPLAIRTLRYYAGWCDKIQGRTIPIEGNFFCYTREEPVGVCVQIIPWNYPILMMSWKWGPLLAAGCCSILKPSEKTPLSILKVGQLIKEAGFPAGVLQILNGHGDVGEYLVKHIGIDKIAFTGSTKIGKKIMSLASTGGLKRVTLELGGKSPNIICHDADLDYAVETSHNGTFFNMGQSCDAGTRVYVHEKIYDEFIKKSIEMAKKVVIGDQFNADTTHGPQIDSIQFNSIMNYIQIGKDQGAKCVVGGNRWGDKGYFIEPTIFADVKDEMTIAKEEIFGPVMSVFKFSDYDEVIIRANDTQYGLAAGIVTNSVEIYQKLANGIRAGTIYVNCYGVTEPNNPFGGFKSSGIGRELGEPALKNYLESKTIIVKKSNDSL